jgi:hypothetical protein
MAAAISRFRGRMKLVSLAQARSSSAENNRWHRNTVAPNAHPDSIRQGSKATKSQDQNDDKNV